MSDNQRFYYLDNYHSFCSTDCFINQKISEYFDNAVRIDVKLLLKYLLSFKEQYSHNNYMFILESISNYIFILLKLTYKDYYIDDKNVDTSIVLDNIKARLAVIKKLYDSERYNCENKNNDYNGKHKNNKGFVKRKIGYK